MRARLARGLLAPFLAGLVLAGAGPAMGKGKGGVQVLPVTGHTVGGPALLDLRDEERKVWASDSPERVCVSVSNGNGDVELEFTQTGAVETAVTIAARQAVTLCRDAVEEVAFSCFAPPNRTCFLSWRVDR
jgi:hypothetical protein